LRLAGYLGWSEDQVRDGISGLALATWEILEDVDPWGQRREDLRFARLAWVFCRVNGSQVTFTEIEKLFCFGPDANDADGEFPDELIGTGPRVN
jgi:hypothetical protein